MASQAFAVQNGQFVLAKTNYCERDGWYEEVCKIIGKGEYPEWVLLQTENGKTYHLPQSYIIKYIMEKPNINYRINDIVEAVVDYHWKDGESLDFCKIIDHKIWGAIVTYILTSMKDPTCVYNVKAHSIKKRVQLQVPKFSVGNRVSYEFCIGHPFYHDSEIKHGHITHIIPWYDKVSYVIKFDDGTVETKDEYLIKSFIPPAPKKDPFKNIDYLNQQEEILIAQLEYIRTKKQEIS
jgi:hypothetical protein